MDPARGLVDLFTALGETAVQRGFQLAAGLGAADLPTTVAGMADDSRANADLMVSLVRSEVDKAVARMGFVREEELSALRRHVERLEAALRAAGVNTESAGSAGAESAATESKKPAAKKPVKKPAAKKPVKKPAKKPAKKNVVDSLTDDAGSAGDEGTA